MNSISRGIKKYKFFILFYFTILAYDFIHFISWKNIYIGDAQYYWMAGDAFLNESGSFSLLNYFDNWPYLNWGFKTFRGYLVPLITLLIRQTGTVLNVNCYVIYFLISAFIYSFAFDILFPKLYETISEKKCSSLSKVTLFLIFFTIWRGYFYFLLLDLYFLIASVGAFYYMIIFMKKNGEISFNDYFFWGVILTINTQLRPNGVFLFYVVVFVILFTLFKNSFFPLKKLIIFILGILLIGIPQMIIFFDAGLGFMLIPKGDVGFLLTSVTMNWINLTAYPFTLFDTNGIEVLNKYFAHKDIIIGKQSFKSNYFTSVFDIFSLWACYPVESIKNFILKLFCGMDIRFSNPYPVWNGNIEKLEILFSMVLTYCSNFLGIFSIYSLFKKSKLNFYEIFFFGIITIQVLLQALLHIEWRYFILGYFLIYFFVSYYFIDIAKELLNKKHILKFVFFFIVFIVISLYLGSETSKELFSLECVV